MQIQQIPSFYNFNIRAFETTLHVFADKQGRTGQSSARYRYSRGLYLYTDIIIPLTKHQHTKSNQRQRPAVLQDNKPLGPANNDLYNLELK